MLLDGIYLHPGESSGKDVNPEELSLEELQKASSDDKTPDETPEETPQKKDNEDDKNDKDLATEKDETEDTDIEEVKKEKPPKEPTLEELEKIPAEERTDIQKEMIRRLHAQGKMTKATQKVAKLQKLLNESEKTRYELEKSKKKEFTYLDEDEEDALMREDPDEYKKYQQDKQAHEKEQLEQVQVVQNSIFNNIVGLFQKLTNNNDDIEVVKKSPEFQAWVKSDEFLKIDQYVTGNMMPRYDGVYTIDQMMDAHKIVNFNSIVSKSKVDGRKEALDDIENANKSGSKLDKISQDKKGKSSKKLKDLTFEEIDEMGVDELKQWEEDLKLQDMA